MKKMRQREYIKVQNHTIKKKKRSLKPTALDVLRSLSALIIFCLWRLQTVGSSKLLSVERLCLRQGRPGAGTVHTRGEDVHEEGARIPRF